MSIKLIKNGCGFHPAEIQELLAINAFNKEIFTILDRDGTLVRHAPRPDLAVFTPEQMQALLSLSDRFNARVAVVSARGLPSLMHDFDRRRFILAGSYGMALSFPSGIQYVHPAARRAEPTILRAFEEMQKRGHPSLIYDFHINSFSAHFQEVPPQSLDSTRELIASMAERYPSIRFRLDESSYEVLPDLEWDKAKALDSIFNFLDAPAEDFFCIAFGDSHHDEPMFDWVNKRCGLSCKVGGEPALTSATAIVDCPEDVYRVLNCFSQAH